MASFQVEDTILETRNLAETFLRISSYYLPKISPNVSLECAARLLQIKTAFQTPESLFTTNRWVLSMIDSWGKSEDGLMEGNRRFLGNFEECLSVKVGNSESDNGRYCIMKYGVSSSEGQTRSPPFSPPVLGTPVIPQYATCIPSSCSEEDLVDSLESSMGKNGFELLETYCQSRVDDVSLDSSEIFGIVFFSVFAFIMISASVIDLLLTSLRIDNLRKGEFLQYLLAFSIPGNMKKIFRVNTEPRPGDISCIHGIRFLSITWVVLGHQFLFAIYAAANPYYVRKITDNFLMQIITNATVSVDTFFVMSGLLVSYTVLKYVKTAKNFPFISYYVNRFLRLAPPIAMAVLFFATLASLCISGPYATKYKSEKVESCRQYWWLDWTFGSNFVQRFGEDIIERTGDKLACLPQCWYVSVDTQLYIVMPLILLPILLREKVGYFLLIFWTAISVLIPALVIGLNDLYPTSMISYNIEQVVDYSYLVYMMPYCRATPYLVGLGTGILLHKHRNTKVVLSSKTVAFGWLTATIVALYVIFGVYNFNYFAIDNPADDMSLGYSVFYGAFHRGLWGACVCWVIIACHWGYGGIVNSFLSHPSFQPLSRLTFSIYITSLPTQYLVLYSGKRLFYYDMLAVVMDTCGILFISGVGGLLLALTCEFPVGNILNQLKSRPQSGGETQPAKNPNKVENGAKANA